LSPVVDARIERPGRPGRPFFGPDSGGGGGGEKYIREVIAE
jgi:hypothetical protein